MIARYATALDAHAAGLKATDGLGHLISYEVEYSIGIGFQVVITCAETGNRMGYYCPLVEVVEAA